MKDVAKVREMYPEGMIIELEEMKGESHMPYGMKGTVQYVDDIGQVHVSWENGSSLALNVEEDSFNKIEPPSKISVLYVEPGEYAKMIEIEDTLEAMQKLVGGYIEQSKLLDDSAVSIICNEEGKFNGMRPNRAIFSEGKEEIIDIVFGPFFVCYAPYGSEKFQSLPPEIAEKYSEVFKYPERFFRDFDGKIQALPYEPKIREADVERER